MEIVLTTKKNIMIKQIKTKMERATKTKVVLVLMTMKTLTTITIVPKNKVENSMPFF